MPQPGNFASQSEPHFLSDLWAFLNNNKKWWLLPILLILFMIGVLAMLSSSAAAPFIYTLF